MKTDDMAPPAPGPDRPNVSRREFVLTGASALGAAVLAGCTTPTVPVVGPRLSARPGIPTATPQLGLSALELGADRDGLLYVPQSYSPDTPMPLFVALHGAGAKVMLHGTRRPALEELAKYYEHRQKDLARALETTRAALDALLAYGINKIKQYGIVDSGDAKKDGIGAMTEARWRDCFETMSGAGVYPKTLDVDKAFTLQFVDKKAGMRH